MFRWFGLGEDGYIKRAEILIGWNLTEYLRS